MKCKEPQGGVMTNIKTKKDAADLFATSQANMTRSPWKQ
jgi:hypothetical protein